MSVTKSKQARKQRKAQFNAPAHRARKMLASHLAEDLILRYNTRAVPVVLGDTVKVLRGEHKGHTGKVAEVDVRKRTVTVEGMTNLKADGTKVPRPVHTSNLIITKLNMADPRRRDKLASHLTAEERKKALAEMAKSADKDKAAAEEAKKSAAELRKAASPTAEADEAEDEEDDDETEPEAPAKAPAKAKAEDADEATEDAASGAGAGGDKQ